MGDRDVSGQDAKVVRVTDQARAMELVRGHSLGLGFKNMGVERDVPFACKVAAGLQQIRHTASWSGRRHP